jgi:hypothetical protein
MNAVNMEYTGRMKLLGGEKARIVKGRHVVTRGKDPKYGTIIESAPNFKNPNGHVKYWLIKFHNGDRDVVSSYSLQVAGTMAELDHMCSVSMDQWPHLPEKSGMLVDFHGNWLPRPPGPVFQTAGAMIEHCYSQESDLLSVSVPQPVECLS